MLYEYIKRNMFTGQNLCPLERQFRYQNFGWWQKENKMASKAQRAYYCNTHVGVEEHGRKNYCHSKEPLKWDSFTAYDCLYPFQQVPQRNEYRLEIWRSLFRIRICMFLGLLDPDLDSVIICTDPVPDPDPSSNAQKNFDKRVLIGKTNLN